MLNFDRDLRGAVPGRARRPAAADEAGGQPFSDEARPAAARTRGLWGERPGRCTSGIFMALGSAVLLLGRSSSARRSATRCAPSASTPRRRATAASRSGARSSWRWASRARSRASPASGEVLGVSTASPASTSRSRRSASPASPSRCSAATTPSASSWRRSCSPRCDSGARYLSGEFSAELARSLATIIQGVIILLVGGEAILRWLFARARKRRPASAARRCRRPTDAGGRAIDGVRRAAPQRLRASPCGHAPRSRWSASCCRCWPCS